MASDPFAEDAFLLKHQAHDGSIALHSLDKQQFISNGGSLDANFKLRSYDKSLTTRKVCRAGLITAWALCGAGVIVIIVIAAISSLDKDSDGKWNTNAGGTGLTVVLPLALAVIVTACNECLGFTHTATLRWALWHEGRLDFNTNLRLLTRARTSRPNSWYINLVSIFLTALSYAAAGQVLLARERSSLSSVNSSFAELSVSLPAIALMTFALASQAVISTWALVSMKRQILTWSSNSLNNSLVCVHGGLERQLGQSLVPCYKPKSIPTQTATAPIRRQASLGNTRPAAKLVTSLLWVIAFVTYAWAGTTHGMGYDRPGFGRSILHRGAALNFGVATGFVNVQPFAIFFISITISLATQLIYTFGLHCAELLVNATRDERTWRNASRLEKKGATIDAGAVKEACTSWETVALFVIKTAVHWAFGEAVKITFQDDGEARFDFWGNSLFVLAAMMTITALFASYLCFRPRHGPQPTAYGHIQTLNNLIDDWGVERGPLYWGDKGHVAWEAAGEIRRAGTAGDKQLVGPIHMEAKYK